LPRCPILDFSWVSLLEVLSRTEMNFKDLVLPGWHHTSVAGRAIFRRVIIRSELLLLIANYTKIKRVELMESCITIARKGNWVLEKWEDIEEVERGIGKLKKEAEGRSDKDNRLNGKTTQDRCLFLQPSKRLKTCLLCKGGFLE